MVCPNMKKTSLESVRDALEKMQYAMELDSSVIEKACVSLDRMFAVS
jgi:quinolinate synthase